MDILPLEIVKHVIFHADQNSKHKLRQTCTTLFELIDQTDFTIYFARPERLNKIVKVFSRYNKPISLNFTKTISLTPKAVNKLSKLTNLTALSFDVSFQNAEIQKEMMGLSQLTNLRQLDFEEQIDWSLNNHGALFPYLTQLTRLSIHMLTEELADLVSTNLRELYVYNLDRHIQQRMSTFKYLTSLTIRNNGLNSAYQVDQIPSLKTLVLDNRSFIGKVTLGPLTNLKNLSVNYYNIQDVQKCDGLTALHYEGSEETFPCMKEWTALTNLKKLELNLRGYIYRLNFLSALSNLEDFVLRQNANPPDNLFNVLPSILTALEISTGDYLDPGDLTRFVNLKKLKLNYSNVNRDDVQFLTSMMNLTALTITSPKFRPKSTKVSLITCLRNLKVLHNDIHDLLQFQYSQMLDLESLTLPILTEEILNSLAELTKLTYLSAEAIDMTTNIAKKLALKSLNITRRIPDEFWQSLVHLTSLEKLCLGLPKSSKASEIEVQEANIRSLKVLRHLTSLNLYSMSDVKVKCFCRLTSLQRLFLPWRTGPDGGFQEWGSNTHKYTKLKGKMPNLYFVENNRVDTAFL